MPNPYEDAGNQPKMTEILARFERIKNRHSHRDTRMSQVRAIRAGKMSQVAPDLFPESGPWQEPIVANMIDVAARDIAEMLAPLPTLNCTSPTMTGERARENATTKTKVAQGYVAASDLQIQMYTGADQYVTYGFLPLRVEIDYERQVPIVRAIDPVGTYPEFDRFGRVSCMFQRVLVSRDELAVQFPEFAGKIKKHNGVFGSQEVEVVFYHDKNWDLAFMTGPEPILLEKVRNPLGKVMIRVAKRPGSSNDPRGQFDDVIFIQLAKSSMALLALQAAHDAVNAPLIVPSDVGEIPYGPGATIRTNNPSGVGRLPLTLPQEAFAEQAALERELQNGARFPQARTGNSDASIVTGKGVEALMGGYDSQIRGHQAVFARAFSEIIGLCFEVDETIFPDVEKSLRGSANGAPFEVKYTPRKVIKGDYSVDVTYGLMAGLDPNRWLVFALQARSEKMFSRDFMRREMPVDIDVEDEGRKIDIEDMEDAAKQAMMAYAQAIPMLATNNQDPSRPLEVLAKIIADRRKGRALVDSIVEAFAPKEEPEVAQAGPSPEEAMMAAMGGGAPVAPGGPEGAPVAAGAAPANPASPVGPEGQPGVAAAPGEAQGQGGAPAPGGAPDLATLLASLRGGA